MEIDGNTTGGKSKSRGQRTESRPDRAPPRSKSRPREGPGNNTAGPKLVKRKKKVKSENRPDQLEVKEEIFVDQQTPGRSDKPEEKTTEEKREENPNPVRKIRKVKRKSKSVKAATGELKPINQNNEILPDKIEPSAETEAKTPSDQRTAKEENQPDSQNFENVEAEQNQEVEDAPKPVKKIKKIKKKSKSVKKTLGELKPVEAEKIAPNSDEKTEEIGTKSEQAPAEKSEPEPAEKLETEAKPDEQSDKKAEDNQEDKEIVKTEEEQDYRQKAECTEVEKPKRRKKIKSKKSITDTNAELSVEQSSMAIDSIASDVANEIKCDTEQPAENNEEPVDEEKCDKSENTVNEDGNNAAAKSAGDNSVKEKSKSRVRRVKKKVKSTKIEIEPLEKDKIKIENVEEAAKQSDVDDGPLLSVAKKVTSQPKIPQKSDSLEDTERDVTEESKIETEEKLLMTDEQKAGVDEEQDGFHRGISTTPKIELPELPGHIVLGGPNASMSDELVEQKVAELDEDDKMTKDDAKTPKFALDIQKDDIEEYLTVDLEDLTLETPADQEKTPNVIDEDNKQETERKHSRPDEIPPSDRVDGEPAKKNKSGKRPARNAPGSGNTGLQPFPAPRSFIERQHTDEIKLASKTGSANKLNVDVDQIVAKKNNICPCSIM